MSRSPSATAQNPASQAVRIHTLGRFLIEFQGKALPLRARAQRKPLELLKVLVALGGLDVPELELSDSLWPDSEGDHGHRAFVTNLHRLRKLIGHEALWLEDGRLSLVPSACWVDTLAFQALLADATRAAGEKDDAAAWNHMENALALYRGPFLEGEYNPPEILAARERLHRLFLRHIDELGQLLREKRRFEKASLLYLKGLEIDDLAEELYQHLMRCYQQQGRLAEGMSVYQRCCRIFRAKIDVDPSPKTEALHQSLMAEQGRRPSPPPAPSETPPAPAQEPAAPAPPPGPIEPIAERRRATVVFSHLSGYSAMNDLLDPEEVDTLMSRVEGEAVRIVESHGGIVNQVAGDMVLALFGIPTAHEDDPSRAVRAALEMHEFVRGLSPEVERKIGTPLQMHTGINTGLIVTHLRDHREGKYGITGGTVMVGAHLARRAKADEILLGAETNKLAAPYFSTSALKPLKMKGKSQAQEAYRLEGQSKVETRFEAEEQRGFTPFIGRERELEILHAGLEKTIAGEGQFITVVGEAGVGKSRLLHEFRHGLDRDSITVIQGRCQSFGTETSYLPFLDAMRRGLRIRDEDNPSQLLERAVSNIRAIDSGLEPYIPHYLHLLSIPSEDYPLPQNLQGEELRRALQVALAAMFTLYAQQKPLVCILEDWHWADEASNAAMNHLIGLIAHYPLLVAVVYRPELSRGWGNPELSTAIVLKSLNVVHTESIIRFVIKAGNFPEKLGALIYERTGGNPFFIEEVCRALVEDGTVAVEAGLGVLTHSLDAVRLPDSVHAVIRARVDFLDSNAQEVLRMASVIGREFPWRVLERVHSDRTHLSHTLENLKAQGLIQQVRVLPEAEYIFKHVLTQVVVYETLLLQQRREYHALVGLAFEALYADRLEEHTETLALHFEQGEVWDKAADYLFLAAEKVKLHWGNTAALGMSRRALSALEKGGATAERKVRVLVLAGDLESLLGNLEEANQTYDQALENTSDSARRRTIENKRHRQFFVTRGGAKIACYEHGSGKETLLFVNPVLYGLAVYQPIVETLCQEYRIITFAPRGVGASDPLVRPYSLTQHVEDLLAVIETSEIRQVTAVGLSRGAAVVAQLAAHNPKLLKRMIFTGPGIPLPGMENQMKTLLEQPENAEALKSGNFEGLIRRFVGTVFTEPGTEFLKEGMAKYNMGLPLETVASFFLDREEDGKVWELLPRITTPTLVIQGTDDQRISHEMAREIANRIPNALFYSMEGIGHNPIITVRAEFCDLLRHFVKTGTVPEPPRAKG